MNPGYVNWVIMKKLLLDIMLFVLDAVRNFHHIRINKIKDKFTITKSEFILYYNMFNFQIQISKSK